ncbi:MAG: thermonuclease family protein [Victivallaceae bacterium]|nr:thermonuclease family protein [Victivallaceae bacterium]
MKRFFFLLLIYTVLFTVRADGVLYGTALWIVDGDTILLRRKNQLTTVRLWGIDAPEKKQPGGKAATSFLVRLIGRKRVKVVLHGYGKYGRVIGKVYYQGKFINLEMIKAGHAWWLEKYSPEATELKEAERKARESKTGLWQNPGAVRPEFFRHPELRPNPERQTQFSGASNIFLYSANDFLYLAAL